MKAVRYGIIGSGWISHKHAIAVMKDSNSQVAGFMDVDLSRARNMAEQYGINYYTDQLEHFIFNDAIDAFIISVPPKIAPDIVIQAARSGKPILSEKPMAMNVEECDRMIKAIQYNNVKFQIGNCQLFYAPNIKAKELLNQNIIGDVYFVRSILSKASVGGWRLTAEGIGEGELLDSGMHRLYTLRSFIGEVKKVNWARVGQRNMKKFPNFKGENLILAEMESVTGIIGMLEIVATHQVWDDRTEIYGEHGIMIINGGEKDRFVTSAPLMVYLKDNAISYNIEHDWQEAFSNQLTYFTQCIINNTSPEMNETDGRRLIELTTEIYQTAKTLGLS